MKTNLYEMEHFTVLNSYDLLVKNSDVYNISIYFKLNHFSFF